MFHLKIDLKAFVSKLNWKILNLRQFNWKQRHFDWKQVDKKIKSPLGKFFMVVGGLFIFLLFLYLLIPLPKPLFSDPYSTVIESREGELLSASIAADDQWRFPMQHQIPEKFEKAIIAFEDNRFYWHFGVDCLSIGRAIFQNIKKGEVVSGASTITMQIARLSRRRQGRKWGQKIIEALVALKLEIRYRKSTLLEFYAAHAPFGMNVVGLEAASWRYYHRQPDELSWAECATLAVLPNSPGLIHPARNRDVLLAKRNRLLLKLHQKGILTQEEYELSLLESIPEKPYPLPNMAPHLLTRAVNDNLAGEKIRSTLNYSIQEQVNLIVDDYSHLMVASEIDNGAAIVVDLKTGETLAYVGNFQNISNCKDEQAVDMINAFRSPGSTLKPFLYGCLLNEGELLPTELIKDIPTNYANYSPQNYSNRFMGAVPANKALASSLNVPFVFLLQKYGNYKFYDKLVDTGFFLHFDASYYGLTLILGGCEVRLWDLVGAYGVNFHSLLLDEKGQPLNQFYFRYILDKSKVPNSIQFKGKKIFDRGAAYLTALVLTDVNRPNDEVNWELFASSQKISWKTGTSFGNRDGWAIGMNGRYLVGVWIGNADGEGRPEIKGAKVAGPLLFSIFDYLPNSSGFVPPEMQLRKVKICKESGCFPNPACPHLDEIEIPESDFSIDKVCPYHQLVHLDETESEQVDSRNYPADKMVHRGWFVLPPVMEWYYKKSYSDYFPLPPQKGSNSLLEKQNNQNILAFIYPQKDAAVYIPIELDGAKGTLLCELAHRKSDSEVFWYLDNSYIGTTKFFHQIKVVAKKGKHRLRVVDKEGNRNETFFTVLSK